MLPNHSVMMARILRQVKVMHSHCQVTHLVSCTECQENTDALYPRISRLDAPAKSFSYLAKHVNLIT